MAIVGVETLTYGVEDLDTSVRFFTDFGLELTDRHENRARFSLPEGSRVEIVPLGHESLPSRSQVVGPGVHEVIWGVDTAASLETLAARLASHLTVTHDADGTIHFLPDFGVAMGLLRFPAATRSGLA
jgi:catechol 2,3-dioxygenase-like lactoylglutathione lyase family enzyme